MRRTLAPSPPLSYKKGAKRGRLPALAEVGRLLRAATPLSFDATNLPEAHGGQSLGALDRIADAYDACLAALPGLYWLRPDASRRACLAGDRERGQLLLLTDERLARSLQERGIPVTRPRRQGDLP